MTTRPPSRGYNPYDSVTWTQDIVAGLKEKVTDAERVLKALQARLDHAIDQHRRQILHSLNSPFPFEREMAKRIAEWWEVAMPDDSTDPPLPPCA